MAIGNPNIPVPMFPFNKCISVCQFLNRNNEMLNLGLHTATIVLGCQMGSMLKGKRGQRSNERK